MVVVDLMKIIGRGHILEVALHALFSQVLLRVGLLVPGNYVGVVQSNVGQLVTQCQPSWHAVVGPTKELDFLASRTHPLNYPINLIWLSTRLPHLTHYDVAIKPLIYCRVSFDPYQAMLLRMI